VADEADEDLNVRLAAAAAFGEMCQGLARFCMTHGVTALEAERSLRQHFVAAARQHLLQRGVPDSIRRVSEITGLPAFFVSEAVERIDAHAQQFVDSTLNEDDALEQLMTLVTTWATHPEFTAFVGVPLELPIVDISDGARPTFSGLLEKTVPTMGRDDAIGTLLAAGVVELADDGRAVKLVKQAVSYKNQRERRIRRFGRTVSALMRTLEANTSQVSRKTLFERTLITDKPIADMWIADFQDSLSDRADEWLSALDAEQRQLHVLPGQSGSQWGVCTFMFQVPNSHVESQPEADDRTIDVLNIKPQQRGRRL
jgi:hypothetical protein